MLFAEILTDTRNNLESALFILRNPHILYVTINILLVAHFIADGDTVVVL